MKRKAVTLQLEGEIPQPQSAYDAAVEEGYEGGEEQYGKEMTMLGYGVTQQQFDAIPGQLTKLTTTTEKSDFHHITDSANMKVVDFGMEGKTEQDTTSGTNILNPNDLITGFLTGEDGTINSTAYGETYKIYKKTLSAGTYTLFINAMKMSISRYILNGVYQVLNSTGMNSYTITVESESEVVLCFRKEDSSEFDGTEEIQLNTGTTALPYEPYTNGPSPNPDYPQEIVNAGKYNEATGRYEHKFTVGNKNLIINEATSTSDSGVDFTVNKDGSILVKGTNTRTYGLDLWLTKKMFLKAGEYVISGGDANNIVIFIHELNTHNYIFSNQRGENSHPVIYTKDTYVEIGLRIIAGATVNDTIYPMLRVKGDNPTSAPLVSKNITLTSPVPLTKWDKLVKRDGVYGWSVNSVKVVTDGTGEWIYNEGLECFYLSCLPESVYNREGFCNQYVVKTSFIYSDRNFIRLGNNNKIVMVCRNSFMDSTLEDKGLANFKAHLAEHPLEIITYADEEQSFHPLPDEEQELLNNLETYYGVTNLYNDQGCPMWLTYVQDTKTAVDNKFNNIRQAVLSLGGNA